VQTAALPIMTAAILSAEPLTLTNMPNTLTDIKTMVELLKNIGVECNLFRWTDHIKCKKNNKPRSTI
jgi:UDP-N-acetylglucosamine enolpyruvyl transferase